MKKLINKKNFLILNFILATIFLGNISYAKYSNIIIGKGYAKISKPIIELEPGEEICLDNNNLIQDYYFNVKNYNDKKTNISMNYYLEIQNNSENILTYKLYKDNEEIELDNNKTKTFNFTNSRNEKHEYKLIIELDNSNLIEEQSIINLKIHSQQENN